jgi:hypothetical protein
VAAEHLKKQELAGSGRFVLPFRGETPARRFAELHTALLLHGEGFFSWGGVHLFYPADGRKPKGRKTKNPNTEDVQSMMRPWIWPNEIQGMLDFLPRNPDIVSYYKKRNNWRFCEVKRRREPIDDAQLGALAVLHLLTAAPVAVVRVVENVTSTNVQMLSTGIGYKKKAQLNWIHPSLRKRCE